MAVILPVNGVLPKQGEDCFIAPNATMVGDVVMGDHCSVWFNAVIRGDVNSITMGNKVNVQGWRSDYIVLFRKPKQSLATT